MENKLNKEKYIKRVIIVAWVCLAICFIIKLFGGNLFQIVCNNQTFIKICKFADNNKWAWCIIASTNCIILAYFSILAMCGMKSFNLWQLIIVIVGNILATCFKVFIDTSIGTIFDIFNAIILPCVLTIKRPKRHWFVILGNILIMIFQLISMFVKNIELGFVDSNGVLISAIFSLDVLIMVVLYYLYTNLIIMKKEK